jgi:hypothetical protein
MFIFFTCVPAWAGQHVRALCNMLLNYGCYLLRLTGVLVLCVPCYVLRVHNGWVFYFILFSACTGRHVRAALSNKFSCISRIKKVAAGACCPAAVHPLCQHHSPLRSRVYRVAPQSFLYRSIASPSRAAGERPVPSTLAWGAPQARVRPVCFPERVQCPPQLALALCVQRSELLRGQQ